MHVPPELRETLRGLLKQEDEKQLAEALGVHAVDLHQVLWGEPATVRIVRDVEEALERRKRGESQ